MRTNDPKEFGLRIRELAEAMKGDMDTVVRKISIDLLSSVIEMSPVGNPELWAANESAVLWNNGALAVNSELRENPANLTSDGRLRSGLKVKPRALRAGKGYVGGAFKHNWIVSVNGLRQQTREGVDPDGKLAMELGELQLEHVRAGDVIYIQNHLPYAVRLEYGWSKQAPVGMVAVTAVRFRSFIDQAVASSRSDGPQE